MTIFLSKNEKSYLKDVLSFSEAEKYIKKFKNKTFVIKYGGNALTDKYLANNFAKDICLIKKLGINLVIVHGGGPQISETLIKKKIKTEFINGLRVTNKETMKVVKDVLINRINRKIVKLIKDAGGKAISLPGNKNSFIKVEEINKELGFVGRPKKIKINIIKKLLKKNYIPIVASLGSKNKNLIYNINADTVAGELASALSATRFYFITNIKGVMDQKNKLIKEITLKKARILIKKKLLKEE